MGKGKMKAIAKPSEEEIARLCNETLDVYNKASSSNIAIILCAVGDMFKLGPKRAEQLVELISKKTQRYEDYGDDIISGRKLKEELLSYGFKEEDIYRCREDIRNVIHKLKIKERSNATNLIEATEMREKYKVMKALVNGGGTHGL